MAAQRAPQAGRHETCCRQAARRCRPLRDNPARPNTDSIQTGAATRPFLVSARALAGRFDAQGPGSFRPKA